MPESILSTLLLSENSVICWTGGLKQESLIERRGHLETHSL